MCQPKVKFHLINSYKVKISILTNARSMGSMSRPGNEWSYRNSCTDEDWFLLSWTNTNWLNARLMDLTGGGLWELQLWFLESLSCSVKLASKLHLPVGIMEKQKIDCPLVSNFIGRFIVVYNVWISWAGHRIVF